MPLPCGKGSDVTSAALASAAQGGTELGEHVLLPLADALGLEAHEASLLGGVGGALRAFQDPRTEGLGLLGGSLGADDLVGARDLADDLLGGVSAARLEVAHGVVVLLGDAPHFTRQLAHQVVALARGAGGELHDGGCLLHHLDRAARVGDGDRHARHHRRANQGRPLLFGEIGLGGHCTALLARQNGRPYTLVCAPSTRSTGLTKICPWSRFRKVRRSGSSRAMAHSAPRSSSARPDWGAGSAAHRTCTSCTPTRDRAKRSPPCGSCLATNRAWRRTRRP